VPGSEAMAEPPGAGPVADSESTAAPEQPVAESAQLVAAPEQPASEPVAKAEGSLQSRHWGSLRPRQRCPTGNERRPHDSVLLVFSSLPSPCVSVHSTLTVLTVDWQPVWAHCARLCGSF
jgi:hypothetical protein